MCKITDEYTRCDILQRATLAQKLEIKWLREERDEFELVLAALVSQNQAPLILDKIHLLAKPGKVTITQNTDDQTLRITNDQI